MGIALNSFHPEAFIVPFMLFAIYYGICKRWLHYLFLFLVASIIEFSAILVIFLNLYLVMHSKVSRQNVLKLGAFSVGLLVYGLIASEVRILFGFDPTILSKAISERAWETLGASSVFDIPLAVIRSPVNAGLALFRDYSNKFMWLALLLAPVVFLPVFHPRGWIMGFPWLHCFFIEQAQLLLFLQLSPKFHRFLYFSFCNLRL